MTSNAKLKELVADLDGPKHHLIIRSKKHGCMAEHMRYYSTRYSISGYITMWFLMRTL